MKSYKFMIVAGVVFLTACQAKQPLPESTPADTETVTSEAFTPEETDLVESTTAIETAPEVSDSSSAADTAIAATEPGGDYGGQDVSGTWRINGQKTEEANEVSLLGEFGSGIHLGNEMVLSENGDFSYSVSINQGGEGTWKLEGDVITADFTTYEPEVREEQLTMTPETGEDGELLIKMTYMDGYIVFWSRLEGETAAAGRETSPANEEPLPEAEVPVIPQSEIAFEGYPEQSSYDSMKALATEPVKEEEGVYVGSPAIWSTINDGKFLHFYHTYTYPEKLKPENAGYAIIGEDVKLACGLHVGMTDKEAEAIIPGLYHFKWENPEYHSVMDWNANGYPDSWCRQFPQILIAEVENGNEMPLTIGLMLDNQKVIRAIAFNCPTAG